MNPQIDFDNTIQLLEGKRSTYAFIDSLLDTCRNGTVYFHAMHDRVGVMTREHVLNTYSIRARLQEEQQPENPLQGYDELLSNLSRTEHEHIVLTTLGTEKCTVILFTDTNRQEMVGILFTNKVLDKKSWTTEQMFTNGKLLSEQA